jgi:hypothetical protein
VSEYDFEFDAPKGAKTIRLVPLTTQARQHLEHSAPGSKWERDGLLLDADAYLPLLFAFNREGWRVKP